MTDKLNPDWPRVPLPFPPAPPGLSDDETEMALLAVCQALWNESKVPVVAWGSPYDGTELHPPTVN